MSRRLNLTSDAIQTHTVDLDEISVNITLRYLTPVQAWFVTVRFQGREIPNIRCSIGVRLLGELNLPFDIVIVDNSDLELDPERQDDFSQRRTDMIFLTPAEMRELRGKAVQ